MHHCFMLAVTACLVFPRRIETAKCSLAKTHIICCLHLHDSLIYSVKRAMARPSGFVTSIMPETRHPDHPNSLRSDRSLELRPRCLVFDYLAAFSGRALAPDLTGTLASFEQSLLLCQNGFPASSHL